MFFLWRPSVQRSSPITTLFNSYIIFTTNDSEKSFLTPVSTPRISDIPKLYTVFFSPANNWNFMNSKMISSIIYIYTSCIILKRFWDCNWTGKRTSLNKFVHHVLFTPYVSIFINSVHIILIGYSTCFSSTTVTTKSHTATIITIIPTSGLINRTSLVRNIILMNPLIGIICVTTIASIIFFFAWNQYLWSYIDVRPSCISLNFNSIWQSWCSSMGPTWATILRYVLITDIS